MNLKSKKEVKKEKEKISIHAMNNPKSFKIIASIKYLKIVNGFIIFKKNVIKYL